MDIRVIFAQQLAEIVRRLREHGVRADDPQLYSKFQNAFQIVLGGAVGQRPSAISIKLPDLEDQIQVEIVKDNVMAMSAIYFAAQLEEGKFFQVADKVVEQFEIGAIPLGRGMGGEMIYRYMRSATQRFTEVERRSIYARAFGFAQGSVEEPLPNREFADLWIRFLSAVSIFTREVDASVRKALTAQQATKNARDLAVNLSLHGYGIAHFAAVELQDLVNTVLKMLSDADVLQAYGVRDVWQLVERVSGLYLGGAVNGVRQRTLAATGARIIQWLAANQRALSSSGQITFTDKMPLVQDIEQWLAVTGTDDTAMEKYFEPVSLPAQQSIPNLSLGAPQQGLWSSQQNTGGALQSAMQAASTMQPMGKA